MASPNPSRFSAATLRSSGPSGSSALASSPPSLTGRAALSSSAASSLFLSTKSSARALHSSSMPSSAAAMEASSATVTLLSLGHGGIVERRSIDAVAGGHRFGGRGCRRPHNSKSATKVGVIIGKGGNTIRIKGFDLVWGLAMASQCILKELKDLQKDPLNSCSADCDVSAGEQSGCEFENYCRCLKHSFAFCCLWSESQVLPDTS